MRAVRLQAEQKLRRLTLNPKKDADERVAFAKRPLFYSILTILRDAFVRLFDGVGKRAELARGSQ